MIETTSNSKYISFVIFMVITLIFCLCSNLIFTDSRKIRNENYDSSFKLNGYTVKISNAAYDRASRKLTFDFFLKEDGATANGSKPYIDEIVSDTHINDPLGYSSEIIPENKYGTKITVDPSDEDFYYFRVTVTSKENDIIQESTVDEFGQVITHSPIKGEEKHTYVYIDYRLVGFSGERPIQTTVTTSSAANASTYAVTTETTAVSETTGALSTDKATSSTEVAATKPVIVTKSEKQTKSTKPRVTVTTNKQTEVTTTKKPITSTITTVTTTKAKPKITTTKKVTTTKNATSSKMTTTKAKPKTTTAATTVLPAIPLRGLSLKTSSPDNTVTIQVGETTQITPVFTPEETTNKKVYWSSNREDRAMVDNNGVVIGRSPGAVIIQCRSDDGDLTAACMVVVQ